MATYKDLQDKINLDYLNQTTLVPEVKRAIQSAIRNYENHRFWFNETTTAMALTSSQSYLTVPSDMILLDRIDITYTGNTTALHHATYHNIMDRNSVAYFGVPTHYATRGNRFELSPAPNSAYAVTLAYVQSLPTLSADADTNAWTTEAFNLIAHCATIDLLSNVVKAIDQDKINRHMRAERMAYDALKMRNDVRLFTRIVPTTF